ncbi:hypothetical protein PCE1_004318 [Barthelona sp. PCE]
MNLSDDEEPLRSSNRLPTPVNPPTHITPQPFQSTIDHMGTFFGKSTYNTTAQIIEVSHNDDTDLLDLLTPSKSRRKTKKPVRRDSPVQLLEYDLSERRYDLEAVKKEHQNIETRKAERKRRKELERKKYSEKLARRNRDREKEMQFKWVFLKEFRSNLDIPLLEPCISIGPV